MRTESGYLPVKPVVLPSWHLECLTDVRLKDAVIEAHLSGQIDLKDMRTREICKQLDIKEWQVQVARKELGVVPGKHAKIGFNGSPVGVGVDVTKYMGGWKR